MDGGEEDEKLPAGFVDAGAATAAQKPRRKHSLGDVRESCPDTTNEMVQTCAVTARPLA